ncbi:helix-turn-helix domain-containing protein [Telmatospirillum sp. J64-1]|uniref:helix-turn-helix domain-containing protein n=1 Tax=Telmatospirillum sp. J64-1 TaxID=2502183 RepID=UPI00115E18A8|nr:helix-turn-helix domain-containing protein [Telmatospirillum sp. J64-1]
MTKRARARDMHPEDIKAELRKRGGSLKSLSESWGYRSRAVISIALRQPWPDVEAKIAETLGKHPAEVWPDRYNPDGTPKKGRPSKANRNTQKGQSNMQLREAA